MKPNHITIGSRGSDLALWQARLVQKRLKDLAGISADIHIIKTKGDEIQHLSFDKMEGKGFFTKEIEQALLDQKIDLAVHSFKDLETTQPQGLCIAAVSERENPADVLLIRKEAVDFTQTFHVKPLAKVGTSSARRKSQMHFFRPDVELLDLRGNVPTRVQRLKDGLYDAILLAKAGLDRLQIPLHDFEVFVMNPKQFIPAPAQGVLALQIRSADSDLHQAMQALHHAEVWKAITWEREILKSFGGGCQVPIGVYAEVQDQEVELWVSKGEGTEKAPMQWQVNSKGRTPAQWAQEVFVPKTQKVFISTDEASADLFVRMLKDNAYQVHAQSLIETELLPGLPANAPKSDWLFFNSKKALLHFEQKYAHGFQRKIGVAGQGTLAALHKLGYQAQFVAQQENTLASAKDFANSLQNQETVLFPESQETLGTFQSFLNKNQAIPFPVYQTKLISLELPEFDTYVFTSPSNARSFAQKNVLPPKARVIAMGEKTQLEIIHHFPQAQVELPLSMDILGLARSVLS